MQSAKPIDKFLLERTLRRNSYAADKQMECFITSQTIIKAKKSKSITPNYSKMKFQSNKRGNSKFDPYNTSDSDGVPVAFTQKKDKDASILSSDSSISEESSSDLDINTDESSSKKSESSSDDLSLKFEAKNSGKK